MITVPTLALVVPLYVAGTAAWMYLIVKGTRWLQREADIWLQARLAVKVAELELEQADDEAQR